MTKAEKQSTEVAIFDQSAAKINEMMGFVTRQKPQIPLLKVNAGDDDDDNAAPSDTIVYDDGDNILYAKEVNIRVFFMGYQYRLYDKDDKAKNDMSIIAPTFNAEFRSLSGRIACGKKSKKVFEGLGNRATAQQVELQKSVKCKLLIFGLVSGKFTNLDTGTEVEVKDALFNWGVSQSAFITMAETVKGVGKERRAIASTPIKLTLQKKKEGKVTFYVPVPEVLPDTVKLAPENKKHLEEIAKFVKDTNDYVNQKYNTAHKVSAENDEFSKVGKTIEGSAKVIDDMPNDPLDI